MLTLTSTRVVWWSRPRAQVFIEEVGDALSSETDSQQPSA